MEANDDDFDKMAELVAKKCFTHSVKAVTTFATGNPQIGQVVGKASGAVYSQVPAPVRGGAAIGSVAVVCGAAHATMALGAAAGATMLIAVAPFAIAGGALLGGVAWLFSDKK